MITENVEAQKLGEGLVRLFGEYATKLEKSYSQIRAQKRAATRKAAGWMGSPEWHASQDRFLPLRSALTEATREASQLAEQGAVGDLARFELRIRLAEIEGLLNSIDAAINQP